VRRGLSVITTSGALTTLLLGLAALAEGDGSRVAVPEDAGGWIVAALVSFGLAALFAVLTNIPLGHRGADIANLRGLIDADEDTEAVARRAVVDTRLDVLASADSTNGWKAWALLAAMVCELAGIALIGYVGWLSV
jgi:hypothetical protein